MNQCLLKVTAFDKYAGSCKFCSDQKHDLKHAFLLPRQSVVSDGTGRGTLAEDQLRKTCYATYKKVIKQAMDDNKFLITLTGIWFISPKL